MSKVIKNYKPRLDNSICDFVSLKEPARCFERDKTTPKTLAWYEKCFPHRIGVLVAHINPNDTTGRKVFIYMDDEKPLRDITDIETAFSEFQMTPKKFYDCLTTDGKKKHLVVTDLDNLVYVSVNKIKRLKIVCDGATYALVNDLDNMPMTDKMKKSLADFNYQNRKSETPVLSNYGLVDMSWNARDLYPYTVTFPNKVVAKLRAEDMMLFHEVNE